MNLRDTRPTEPPEERFQDARCAEHGYDDIDIVADENEYGNFDYPVCAICGEVCERG